MEIRCAPCGGSGKRHLPLPQADISKLFYVTMVTALQPPMRRLSVKLVLFLALVLFC